MAIIRYSKDNGNIPSYISDGGYFRNPANSELIGIGSGGGTTIASKADLITYALSIHANYPYKSHPEGTAVTPRTLNTSEVTAIVNNWCTARSIS
tara:strand:+ start:201 stop:485 length:285 start_codon:yes stop_codon:yes gene_type:complete